MLELERLNVRVVSGRSGAKEDEYGEGGDGVGVNGLSGMGAPRSMDPNMFGSQDMNSMKKDKGDSMPPHRPLVGGGSAAAYEAARAEHYRELEERKKKGQVGNLKDGSNTNGSGGSMNGLPSSMQNNLAMRGSFSGGMGPGGPTNNGAAMPSGLGGLSINANQHYEMLKLHHMNLLNEIQETTLMMNIYQQQQLQQQQQQQQMQQQQQQQQMEQQRRNSSGYGPTTSDNSSAGGMGPYGGGLNGSAGGNTNNGNRGNMGMGMPPSSNTHMSQTDPSQNEPSMKNSNSDNAPSTSSENGGGGAGGESREDKLAKIKAEIEERKRMLEELAGGGEMQGSEHGNKRAKTAV